MSNQLEGRTAIVTGATGGMGSAIARQLVSVGAKVMASDLTDTGAPELLTTCAEGPGTISFHAANVANADEVASLVAEATRTFGDLHCAVNAAAIEFETVPLAQCADEDFDYMMAVNTRGVFLSMKHEILSMIESGSGGSIVNVASTNSFRPQHDQPAYTASKHAVLGLTRSAAIDYAKSGIRINAICPGAIDTPMLRNAMERRGRKVEDVAGRLSYFGRFGQADEIAKAALWLCSDASSFTTGHALAVDGGMLAG